MARSIVRFLTIIVTGMIAGATFGIWAGLDPRNLSGSTYTEQQQNVISGLNILMPVLGLIAIVLTLISAFLQKKNRPVLVTLIIAALLLIAAGLITKLGNQPINSIVMTWNKENLPDNWTGLRDKWWMLHTIRTTISFIAFALTVWAGIRKE